MPLPREWLIPSCRNCKSGLPIKFASPFGIPLSNVHPYAEGAAEAVEAASAQGRFWEMHDLLYNNQQALDHEDLLNYARELELDVRRFTTELNERLYAPRVREDFLSGVRSGVNGTPSFFINGVRHDGSWDFDSLLAALQKGFHGAAA